MIVKLKIKNLELIARHASTPQYFACFKCCCIPLACRVQKASMKSVSHAVLKSRANVVNPSIAAILVSKLCGALMTTMFLWSLTFIFLKTASIFLDFLDFKHPLSILTIFTLKIESNDDNGYKISHPIGHWKMLQTNA
jgi:hypothetical protein